MPATILQGDVITVAPELETFQAWEDVLAYVNEFDITQTYDDMVGIPQTAESNQTDRMAKIFLAAHIATMVKRAGSGTAGPVTGVSVGGVRRSYGLLPFGTGLTSLSSTRYGQLYMEVVGMTSIAGPMLV